MVLLLEELERMMVTLQSANFCWEETIETDGTTQTIWSQIHRSIVIHLAKYGVVLPQASANDLALSTSVSSSSTGASSSGQPI